MKRDNNDNVGTRHLVHKDVNVPGRVESGAAMGNMHILQKEPAEDEVIVKGRQLCGGDYPAMIGMFPLLTPSQYHRTIVKIFLTVILTVFVLPMHLCSLHWAIKADEYDIALENVSQAAMVMSLCCMYWLMIYRRSLVKDLFRRLGSGVFRYSIKTSIGETALGNTQDYASLLVCNKYFTLLLVSIYFLILPALNVLWTGKISTENDGGKYPFNKNLPVHVAPIFRTDTLVVFLPTFSMQTLLAYCAGLIMLSISNLYLGLNVQIWNQLKTLKQSLENIHERASVLFEARTGQAACKHLDSKEFQDCMTSCLKDNIKHHNEIIKFFRDFTRIFSDWLFLHLLVSASIICLTFYLVRLVGNNSYGLLYTIAGLAGRLLMLFFNVFHAVIYCLVGQKTTDLSHELHESYYFCGWHAQNSQEFKKIIAVGMTMANRPFITSGFGIIPAKAETLVSIMKSAFSLLNFLIFLVG